MCVGVGLGPLRAKGVVVAWRRWASSKVVVVVCRGNTESVGARVFVRAERVSSQSCVAGLRRVVAPRHPRAGVGPRRTMLAKSSLTFSMSKPRALIASTRHSTPVLSVSAV